MARTKKRADTADTADAPPADAGWGTPVAGAPSLGGEDRSMADVLRDDDRAKGQPGRGRTWLILLTSLVAQLVVIGAAGNTGVVGNATDYARDHATVLGRFAALPAVVSWRIKQPTVDPGNLLVSEWFGLLALVVVAALLTAVLVRGPVTFVRTGVAVWLAVIVATLANGMVRRGVVNDRGSFDSIGGKASGVLFAGTGREVIAGVIIGLVAAIAAAIVAVVTRRPAAVVLPAAEDEPAPYVEPAAPPPWHGDDQYGSSTRTGYAAPYESSYAAARVEPPAGPTDEPVTTTFPAQPAAPHEADVTTQFPAVPAEVPASAPPPPAASEPVVSEPVETPAAGQAPAEQAPAERESTASTAVYQRPPADPTTETANFPRPPDDEDLGDHPSDDDNPQRRS